MKKIVVILSMVLLAISGSFSQEGEILALKEKIIEIQNQGRFRISEFHALFTNLWLCLGSSDSGRKV